MIKLNIGCGGNPLKDYINIDQDSLEQIRKRYPEKKFEDDLILKNHDIFNLPFDDSTVDEIKSDSLIEHLNFIQEKKFFNEIKRVIKVGGRLEISTPDFEMAVKQWLAAKDDWKDFFRDDDEAIKQNHWFGNYNNKPNNRWGYLLATIFGSQNGEGQFHRNCYTEKKLIAICKKIGIKIINIERFQWKEDRDHMLKMIATK
tara:strand:+ start:4485 stop:5087 length:603 start_codon:yes stop_codon:yes gene_type:complete